MPARLLGAADNQERTGGKDQRPGQISSFSGCRGVSRRPSKYGFRAGRVEDKGLDPVEVSRAKGRSHPHKMSLCATFLFPPAWATASCRKVGDQASMGKHLRRKRSRKLLPGEADPGLPAPPRGNLGPGFPPTNSAPN